MNPEFRVYREVKYLINTLELDIICINDDCVFSSFGISDETDGENVGHEFGRWQVSQGVCILLVLIDFLCKSNFNLTSVFIRCHIDLRKLHVHKGSSDC